MLGASLLAVGSPLSGAKGVSVRRRALLLAAIVVWFGWPTSRVSADPLAIAPSSWEAFADGDPFDGTPDYFEVRHRLFAGYSNSGVGEFRSAMEFDINALGARPAFLNLFVDRVFTPDFGIPAEALPFQLYGYTGDGRASRSDFSAGTLLDTFVISSLGTMTLDVSSFVATVSDQSDRFAGFLIKPIGDPFTNKTNYFFASPNRAVGSSGPPLFLSSSLGDAGVLVPAPVPEPGTFILVGTTGLALIGRRLRRVLGRCD